MRGKRAGRWRILACLLLLGACASPAARFEDAARALGLEVDQIPGAGFDHALIVQPASEASAGQDVLHVYLGGDGTPTVAGLPVDDPTPRQPLVLRLMALDRAPAIILGRPCYHGLGPARLCTSEVWTEARYGERVVASLAAALERHARAQGAAPIVWFGYSGGGALAMLLAERVPQTVAVVTVAANLDLAAWARHHGRSPLDGSLDPATRPPLAPSIVQRHYVGSADSIVPPATLGQGLAGADVVEIAGFDHVCCWKAIWPEVLAEVDAALARTEQDQRRE